MTHGIRHNQGTREGGRITLSQNALVRGADPRETVEIFHFLQSHLYYKLHLASRIRNSTLHAKRWISLIE